MSRYRYWAYHHTLLRMDMTATWFPRGAVLRRDGRWRPHEGPDRNYSLGSDYGDEITETEAAQVVGALGLAPETLTDPRLWPSSQWPQAPTRIGVRLERGARDDTGATHVWTFEIDTLTMLGELIEIAVAEHCLAGGDGQTGNVETGDEDTWVVRAGRAGRRLAVLARRWPAPRWLTDPAAYVIRIRDVYVDDREEAGLYVGHDRADPAAVLASLLAEPDAREYPNTFKHCYRAQPERPPAPR